MIKNILLSLRPHFWILSIIPALTGAYLANNHTIAWKDFLLIAILIGPCLSGISEIVNDYADRETDLAQNVKKIWKFPFSGGSGAVRIGGITKNETTITTLLLTTIAFAIAFYFNWQIVAVTAIGLSICLEYSLAPLHFKIRGIWGTLSYASGFRGFVSFYAGWLVFAPASGTSWVIASFFALLFASSFPISHLADYDDDKKLGINTFPVSFGFDATKNIAAGFFLAAPILILGAQQADLVNPGFFTPFWILIGTVYLAKYLSLKNNTLSILRLSHIALAVICTAPLIFF